MDANVIRYWMFDVSNLLTKTMICKKGKNTTMSFEIILSVVDTNRTYLYRTSTSFRESAKSNSHHDRTYHNFSSVGNKHQYTIPYELEICVTTVQPTVRPALQPAVRI